MRGIVCGRKAATCSDRAPSPTPPPKHRRVSPSRGIYRALPRAYVACSSSHIPKEHEFQLQKAFIEQAAQCDAFNVKGRTMPMTAPYTPRNILRQPANIRSSAYIGIAAILAVFIVAFATAPKARAQDNGHHPHHAAHHCKWYSQASMHEAFLLRQIRPPELSLFSRRS